MSWDLEAFFAEDYFLNHWMQKNVDSTGSFPQADGEICTIELPDNIIKQWGDKDEFKVWHEDFLLRNPPASTLASSGNSHPKASATPVVSSRKRPLPMDMSQFLTPLENFKADDEILCEAPIVNARAAAKLTTMPVLVVSKAGGPYIKNETGNEVFQLIVVCIFCFGSLTIDSLLLLLNLEYIIFQGFINHQYYLGAYLASATLGHIA